MASRPPPRPASRAAGALVALTTIVGAVIGNFTGQPTIGVLAGFAIGAAGAALSWLADRHR